MRFLAQHRFAGRGFLFALAMGLALWFSCIISSSAQTLAEGLDTTNLVWTTGGNTLWFGQSTNTHDGIDAVQSGSITSNQTSWIETTIVGPITVEFWSRIVVSSFFSWQATLSVSGPSWTETLLYLSPWSSDWVASTVDLGAGTNVLRWSVSAHSAASAGNKLILDELSVSPPRPPSITYQPGDATVYTGADAFLSATASGSPPLLFQWRKDGSNIVGATSATAVLSRVTTNDIGIYSCVVSNAQGFTISSNALLTVLPPAPPSFTFEPASISGYVGESLYLWGAVDGSPPFSFQWRKNGTNVTGLTLLPWQTSDSLELTNLTLTDAGNYTLFVTNDYGSIESSNAVVTVIPSIAPVIVKHPRSLEVAAGVSTWLSSTAAGDPAPAYQWTKIGGTPPPPDPFPFPQQGQSKRSFTNVTSLDAGIYFATATNLAGQIKSREALLTVLPPISSIGSWWQGAEDIYVTNELAYLAQGNSGFAILSVSNPVTPVLLGGYNTPGFASAVEVVGNRAYVADGSAGLQIFSITNPYSPALLGNYNTPNSATDVSVRSNLAYVADGKSGLLIINVSNPASPSLTGSYKTNFSAGHVRVAGDYAFVSSLYSEVLPGTNVAGFFIISVADPSHPVEIGRLLFGIGNFDIRGQTVYGVNGNSLKAITVTNPAQPSIIGSLDTYGYQISPGRPPFPPLPISASDIRVVNDIAYAGGYSGNQARLYAVDVRDPAEPIPVGLYTNGGQRYALWAEDNVVYFTGTESSLDIIQTPFNPNPTLLPTLTLLAPATQIEVHGRRGFNYAVETATAPAGQPWQLLQTILLTNDTISLPITPSGAAQFFRSKQLD